MILQIDIGNSRIKWRLRRQGFTLDAGIATSGDYNWLQSLAVQHVWVSSVVTAESERLQQALQAYRLPQAEFATSQASVGDLVNGYQDPSSLGVDRWLALLGARQICSGPALVVDAGTALTLDLLAASGRHMGGYIAPGLTLMRQSLALKSPALEVESVPSYDILPGSSSAAAIDAALTAMGRGLIAAAHESLSSSDSAHSVALLFTGGDGNFWRQVMGEGSVEPELLFSGLERYFTAKEY